MSTCLSLVFLLLIGFPTSYECLTRPAHEMASFAALGSALPTTKSLAEFAEQVSRESVVARAVRRHYQELLTCTFHLGSAKVILGSAGHLFMREDLLICNGVSILPQRSNALERDDPPGSITSIIEYEQQVRAAGIHLVVLPVPLAPVLYPETIWRAYPTATGPAWNHDFQRWKQQLTTAGVDVLDVTDDLWRAKADTESPWVPHNTHWAPHGAVVAAARLAQHIRPWLGSFTPASYTAHTVPCQVASDLAHMLDLPRANVFPDFECPARIVTDNNALAREDDANAPVLLLGDSFTAQYSEAGPPGEIVGADFGRQLMFELKAPVQVVTEYGLDPLNGRAKLWGHVAGLRQKRVFVWEFATRHLTHPYTWARIPFPLAAGAGGR